MAFSFKRKERVAKGVRRLGRRQSEAALECLNDCGQGGGVHGARKNIKKARAILRLAAPQTPREIYRRQARLLRAAADKLSPMRDAYVTEQALKDFGRHFSGRLAAAPMHKLQGLLQEALARQRRQFRREKTRRAFGRILRQTVRHWDAFHLDSKGWKGISAGLKTAYKRARKALRSVKKKSHADPFSRTAQTVEGPLVRPAFVAPGLAGAIGRHDR